jgi:cell division protein FtsI/penicillin-binding protein 2
MEVRLKILFIFISLGFCALIGRLFVWQVIKGQGLSELARLQYQGGKEITARRGEIYSSDGTWLAATSTVWLLFADPKKMTNEINIDRISEDLAKILLTGDIKEEKKELLAETLRIKSLLTKKESAWVPIKHKISKNQKDAIESLKIKGLGFEEEQTREYPESSIAAQLLGFVGKDDNGADKGYFGLEGYYDLILSGSSGYQTRESDPRGVPILFSNNTNSVSSSGGVNLVTTIDKTIQLSVEQKLKEGIEKYGASGGSVVVMEPKTGSVLAMASYPSFDPASYSSFKTELYKNPVILSTYEPGSIMKVIIMASALDAGLVTPETKCPICNGPYQIGKYFIKTWDNTYRPNSTMTDVIVESDNVGMTYVGILLGKDRMYDYLTNFGIGQLTGIDLQGEETAKLRTKGSWNDIDLATSSFGQGVAITSMQMIKAVSTIANGGIPVTPRIVGKIKSGNWEQEIKPITGKQIISAKAAMEISLMMAEAASRGESKWAYLPGYKISGKTGTAQIPIEGHYDPEQTIASFIGFAPYDDPKFSMLVTLVKPQSSPWAAETAAPLWYKIAKDIFDYYGMQPEK